MNSEPLNIQFKQEIVKMKSRTQEIHTKKENEYQTTTIRIFFVESSGHFHVHSIQIQNITFRFRIAIFHSLVLMQTSHTFRTPNIYTNSVPSV
jgi:hypothetical protein